MENDDIAIVGLSFKLPQEAEDEDSLWDILLRKRNLMTEWPEARLALDSFYDASGNSPQKLHSRGGHFIKDDPAVFDAPFFSITPKEAISMDPQQRWVLETSYRAFENAGMTMSNIRGSRTAVFGASMADDYTRMTAKDPDTSPQMAATGNASSILANRLSWYFDLRGPSIHVDTACSSSLIAFHLACQSIRHGEASAALVVSTNLMLGPDVSMNLSRMNFLSPDSRCYSFDHRANGYGRGEGIVAMILKPVSQAIQDRDIIRAVIRGSGSNQDGRTPTLTQPSVQSQMDLIQSVYHKFNLDFEHTRYVEAHGTGTPTGDPIEMEAIGKVFKDHRSQGEPLLVGSIKGTTGHLEGSSGLTAVVKSILVLEKGVVPPNASFEKLNPKIDASSYNISVPSSGVKWPTDGLRRVSINSFGFGGSNAHVVLDDALSYLDSRNLTGYHNTTRITSTLLGPSHGQEEALAFESPDLQNDDRPRLLVWSAADEGAIDRMVTHYEQYIQDQVQQDSARLDRLAYTLSKRRTHLLWRTFALVSKSDSERTSSKRFSSFTPARSSQRTGLAFVFTGQGAQYAQMGTGLLHYKPYHDSLMQAEHCFRSLGCEWSILEAMSDEHNINDPAYSQPLCTALQIALVDLLRSFNVVPAAVIGHSSGEIAAAYSAGALSRHSACKLAYMRGQIVSKLRKATTTPGAMLSVNLSKAKFLEFLHNIDSSKLSESVHVACINSPSNITASGSERSIDILMEELDRNGTSARKVRTGVAYHSPHMLAIANEYLESIGTLECSEADKNEPGTLMVSSVTSAAVSTSSLSSAQYWVDNLISPVSFSDAMQELINISLALKSRKITDIVEVGPHGALRGPIKACLTSPGGGVENIRYHSVLNRNSSSSHDILKLLGMLFVHGYDISAQIENGQKDDDLSSLSQILHNCPQYPFDHSKRYWDSTRMGNDYALRKPVPADILGSRCHDWNPLDPRWRNFLGLETHPWIGDHIITGSVVYPGAGLLGMALEAAKQNALPNKEISGYFVKEARFMSPVILQRSGEQPVEVLVHLQPMQKPYEKTPSWSKVKIFTYVGSKWTECSRSIIQILYREAESQFNGESEKSMTIDHVRKQYKDSLKNCDSGFDQGTFYSLFKERGYEYGPSFRVLDDIRWDGQGTAVARAHITDPKYQTPGLYHPAVLDGAIQTLLLPISNGLQDENTKIPNAIFDAWFSASGWQTPYTSDIRIMARHDPSSNPHGSSGPVYALDDNDMPLCIIQTVVPTAVTKESETFKPELLYRIDWQPQLSLLDPSDLQRHCDINQAAVDSSTWDKFYVKLQKMAQLVIRRVVSRLSDRENPNVSASVQKHTMWMRRQVKESTKDEQCLPEPQDLERLITEVEQMHPPWRLIPIVARHIDDILEGIQDPLQLVFDTGLAADLYEGVFADVCDDRFRRYMNLLIHENPSQRMLEVGAGTGSWTKINLDILQDCEKQMGGTAFSEYAFTDVSPSFFEDAKPKFGEEGRMSYYTFDLDRPASSQGADKGLYDVVFAGNVLHATKCLSDTLRNIRSVLKPGGKLIFVEVTKPQDIAINFAFGVLPGWWASNEEWRQTSPLITEPQWDELLRDNQFSGIDVAFQKPQAEYGQYVSLIATTAVELSPNKPMNKSQLLLLVEDSCTSGSQLGLASIVRDNLESIGNHNVRTLSLQDFSRTEVGPDDVVISLLETVNPFFSDLKSETFEFLKELIRKTHNLMWVVATGETCADDPHYSLMKGFFRSMRSEAIEKNIVTLSIEGLRESTHACASHITRVFQVWRSEAGSTEREYIVKGGVAKIGRLAREVALETAMNSYISPGLQNEPWGQGPALKLAVGQSDDLEQLHFVEDPTHPQPLGDNEIEIVAKAWGINFRDIFLALGRLQGVDYGSDCAGSVTRVGRLVSAFTPGDRVGMCTPGCMRRYPRAAASSAWKIPESVSFESAASVMTPAITAYHSLINVARVQHGDKVLIHSAAGATGQLGLMIAQMQGAEIYATVGSEAKKELLVHDFGISPDRIFYSRNTSFAQGVKRVTNGYGVDIVLNSLSGDNLNASWDCLAPYGRFIELGKADITAGSPLSMSGFSKNRSFAAVDIHHMALETPEKWNHLIRDVLALIDEGHVRSPQPLQAFKVSEIEQAFRYFQAGTHPGRVVVTLDDTQIVPKKLVRKSMWLLDTNATYLVAGGFGGIGREILHWMVGKGARNIIVPSRSGSTAISSQLLVEDFANKGIVIKGVACDVSCESDLARVLEECKHSMPPIRGCIDAAMVLHDSVFENMTFNQWELTKASKAKTAWNLHKLLPRNLDFFVLLSSLGGIYGSPAQSNYAAGCTFQDSLAQYRRDRGEKAVSLDIGWMRSVGIIAENETYRRYRENAADMVQIETNEFIAVMDICCDPTNTTTLPVDSQLLIGAVTPTVALLRKQPSPPFTEASLFARFPRRLKEKPGTQVSQEEDPAAMFKHAGTSAKRTAVVVEQLAKKLARAISIHPDNVQDTQPLSEYGVDSLMAVELRNWIRKNFLADVAVFDIMNGTPIIGIAHLVVARSDIKDVL